MPLQLMFE